MRYLSGGWPSYRTETATRNNLKMSRKGQGVLPQLDRFKQNVSTTAVAGEMNQRRELTACVHRLTTAPTSPDRRCSTFQKNEEISQKILAKSFTTRFADEGEDSGWKQSLSSGSGMQFSTTRQEIFIPWRRVLLTGGVDIPTK